ncbi:MAG: bifunctional phosphoglucose/phosphomannose isomerase, partial [Chloroflexota bacterium]
MADLDDAKVYQRLDPANMLEHLHGLPEQCRTAWYKARGLELPSDYADIDKVVVLGMGGSAIGGDLVRSLLAPQSKSFIFVNREYDLPAFIDEKTLVIASSYSGNTEETLSAFAQALKSNCKKLAMTTGGKLKTLAEDAGSPVFNIDIVSQPRAALGYSFIPLIAFLQKLSFVEDKSAEVEAMVKDLEKQLEEIKETVATGANRAKELALKLHNRIVVIYGAGIISEVAR